MSPLRNNPLQGSRLRLRSGLRKLLCLALLVLILVNIATFLNWATTPPPPPPPQPPVDRAEILSSTRRPFSPTPPWVSQWIHNQRIDPDLIAAIGKDTVMDVVYTWVNGSDPAFIALRQKHSTHLMRNSPKEDSSLNKEDSPVQEDDSAKDRDIHRFRDNDELRYSIRSVHKNAPDLFRTIHIVSSNVDPTQDQGQVPSWLNMEAAQGRVEMVSHKTIFDKHSDLPSFNSLSIESQMHHTPGLTDIFAYMNDDIFFGKGIVASDLWTPLYGFVFHLEPTTLIDPDKRPSAEDHSSVGEFESLHYSNYILSKQFGQRYRAYLAHIPHILSAPILEEMQNLWPKEFAATSAHRFRGEEQGREIQVSFMMAHYVMERLRETQLSSYWRYRLDVNQDGTLDWEERKGLIEMIERHNGQRPRAGDGGMLQPHTGLGMMSYLKDHSEILQQAGLPMSSSTIYGASGLDGYAFPMSKADTSKSVGYAPPRTYLLGQKQRLCKFDIDFCLGPDFGNATLATLAGGASTSKGSIFERMAFVEFHCGDCLLQILRRESTEPGLGSVILPMDKTSKAYEEVTASLSRYNYVVGFSYFSFVQLQTLTNAQVELGKLMQRSWNEAFFCINDDVPDNELMTRKVGEELSAFLEKRFPVPSPWEKMR